MITVLQRVIRANVKIEGKIIAEIEHGLLILVGIHQQDSSEDADYLANRIPLLRIFPDDAGKMNKSLLDIKGELLLVSQFTLLGDVYQGRRPGFTCAAPSEKAIPLLAELKSGIENQGITVKEGQFGSHMEIELINDGPVTFIIDSHHKK